MKKIVLIVTVICLSFIGYIFVAGFWDKQQLEKAVTNTQASKESGYAESNSGSSSSTSTAGSETSPSNSPSSSPNSKSFALSEVAQHSSSKDCWLAINGKVYDVTKYIYDHPGGASEIIDTCGTDATVAFKTMNRPGNKTHSSSANQMLADYFIGNLK